MKFFDVVCVIGSLQGPNKGNGTVIFIFPERDTNVNWWYTYLALPGFLKWLRHFALTRCPEKRYLVGKQILFCGLQVHDKSTYIFTMEGWEADSVVERVWLSQSEEAVWFPDSAPSSPVQHQLSCRTSLSLHFCIGKMGLMTLLLPNSRICCEDLMK